MTSKAPILRVDRLSKSFGLGRSFWGSPRTSLPAVRSVSFELREGETLGIVGESGCGKTTLGRLVLRLNEPDSGSIRFDGKDITHLSLSQLRPLRRGLQAVFQDPYSSLDPRHRVGAILAEPLRNFGWRGDRIAARVAELLDIVRLPRESAERYPHAFSGGQRQRIGIARALALGPKLIVCDEAVSALDVSIQAQILNLLREIQRRFDLSLLFISHDLAVVRHLCHRVLVMYLGQVVELATEAEIFERPLHPYTKALLAAAARQGGEALVGERTAAAPPPHGCSFHPRCPIAGQDCTDREPALAEVKPQHWVRCFYPGEDGSAHDS